MRPSTADIRLSPGYTLDVLIEGSGLHSANGVTFGLDGRLYVASAFGESLFAVDVTTGEVETVVGPFSGGSDDLVFTPCGDMIWTAVLEGAVRQRTVGGEVSDLATGIAGANSIALTRDGRRLFIGQVFLGEGLWEIDLQGRAAPRLVVDDTGGLNAFQFGADGMIYAPSWERGQVVRVHPETGATEVLAEGFGKPGAVKFGADEQLYVLHEATGELFALDRAGARWERRRIAKLATATDNMAIGSDGLFYVSNMADSAVHAVDPRTGDIRPIVAPGLGFPRGIAVSAGPEGDLVHLADVCAYRTLDPKTSSVTDIARAVATPLKFPAAVSVDAERVLTAAFSWRVTPLTNFRRHAPGSARTPGSTTSTILPGSSEWCWRARQDRPCSKLIAPSASQSAGCVTSRRSPGPTIATGSAIGSPASLYPAPRRWHWGSGALRPRSSHSITTCPLPRLQTNGAGSRARACRTSGSCREADAAPPSTCSPIA